MDNNYLLGLLRIFSTHDDHIKSDDNQASLINNGIQLCDIERTKIKVLGSDVSKKLIPFRKSDISKQIDLIKFKEFIDKLGSSFLGINHFGIQYSCLDIKPELNEAAKLVAKHKDLDLYLEVSGSNKDKWIYISNFSKPEDPIFELVLNERSKPTVSSWSPHFQIDIDTTLSHKELLNLLKIFFPEDFLKWEMEVDGYGVPLVMGRLATLNGFKIYLGIGTNVRGSRKWHRRECLTKLKFLKKY